MKKSEKILLKQLNENNLNNSGDININVYNAFFQATNATPADPNTWVVSQQVIDTAYIKYRYNVNLYLLGYLDFLSNYSNAQKLCKKVINQTTSTYNPANNFFPFDELNFYVFKDRSIKTINKDRSPLGQPSYSLPIQSFVENKDPDFFFTPYTLGDVLFVNFSDRPINQNVYNWIETSIHCDSMPYTSLLEILQNGKYFLSKLKFDFHVTGSNKSIPAQNELFLGLLKNNIFGLNKYDIIDFQPYVTPQNYNTNILEIPLHTTTENLLLHIPLALNIVFYNFSLSLTF